VALRLEISDWDAGGEWREVPDARTDSAGWQGAVRRLRRRLQRRRARLPRQPAEWGRHRGADAQRRGGGAEVAADVALAAAAGAVAWQGLVVEGQRSRHLAAEGLEGELELAEVGAHRPHCHRFVGVWNVTELDLAAAETFLGESPHGGKGPACEPGEVLTPCVWMLERPGGAELRLSAVL